MVFLAVFHHSGKPYRTAAQGAISGSFSYVEETFDKPNNICVAFV